MRPSAPLPLRTYSGPDLTSVKASPKLLALSPSRGQRRRYLSHRKGVAVDVIAAGVLEDRAVYRRRGEVLGLGLERRIDELKRGQRELNRAAAAPATGRHAAYAPG